jgi:hypothetical protein
MYMLAVDSARRALMLSREEDVVEELTYMLACLHFAGDFRASHAATPAAAQAGLPWAKSIARGLAKWQARATPETLRWRRAVRWMRA